MQKWQRIELPDDYEAKRKIEELRQETDPDYFDTELEKIRQTHWLYRLCGVWIYINGKPVYIPPSFYYYLNWCKLDVGYPTYRDSDRKFYYVWEFCVDDPRCGGLIDIERRRMGKSFKSGSIVLDRTSIYQNHHAGIQSKSNDDAKLVFSNTVIRFFKVIPHFFRPVFDQSKGITPTSELRFFKTTIKGKRAAKVLEGRELGSWADYGPAEEHHYDGAKLNTYIADEYGKPSDVSVVKRWSVVKYCLDQDGVWCGKALFTSTIEEIKGGTNTEAYELWKESDPNKRNENGRTKTGLYRFFLPSYETTFFDEFGYADKAKGMQHYINERDGLKDNPRELSSHIRKNPFTIEEAFRVDGAECLYNPEKLNPRYEWLMANEDSVNEVGNFMWKDGKRLTEVLWSPSKNGRFRQGKKLKPGEANRVLGGQGDYQPGAQRLRVAGCDPFKYDKTKSNVRSDCGAYVYDMIENRFLCEYLYRTPTTEMSNEDILMMCWYYGCSVMYERNVDHWMKFFQQSGCFKFLIKAPGEHLPGLHTDGQGTVVQEICQATEVFIEQYIDNCDFKNLVHDWLEFKVEETTKFDAAMGAGFALLGMKYRLLIQPKAQDPTEDKNDIRHYFRKRRA